MACWVTTEVCVLQARERPGAFIGHRALRPFRQQHTHLPSKMINDDQPRGIRFQYLRRLMVREFPRIRSPSLIRRIGEPLHVSH